MKKDRTIFFILFAVGILFAGAAVFVEIIGLDNAPGDWDWGRIRIAVFAASGFFVLFACIYSRFVHKFNAAISGFWRALQKYWTNILFLKNETNKHKLMPVWEYSLTALILVIILIFYAWLATSGKWITRESSTAYYSSLAESFINGNLDLPIQPDPQLLALENPYDPSARDGMDTPIDLSLYNGKFYMYWGPVPSLLIAVVRLFIHDELGDLAVTFIFVCGIFLVQSALLFSIWNRYFSVLPKWILQFMILLGGLTGPIILLRHNYENARIYEAAIAGGEFFLLSGFLIAFSAATRPSIPEWRLFFVGVLWALAIGTRQILAGPIGVMFVLMVYQINIQNIKPILKIRKLILLSMPLFLGGICLGLYNWERFNSITETGLYYQLAGLNLRKHYMELFSYSYVPQNLYNYLFNPPSLTSKFPFVFMHKGNENTILQFYTVPEFYNAQPVTGLMYIFPFAIFASLPLLILFRNLYNKGLARFLTDIGDSELYTWVSLNLGGSFFIAFSLLMVFFWTGMRYFGDFIPELTVLSALGFWLGCKIFAGKSLFSGLYTFFGVSLGSISILTSTLLAISTNSKLINLIVRHFLFLK